MDQMKLCWHFTKTTLRNQKGQGMVEYGLIIALVAVVAMAGLDTIGDNALTVFKEAAKKLVVPAP